MDTDRGGIAKQVEQRFTLRFTIYPLAQQAVVEKQPGIQVIAEVDQLRGPSLAHLEEFTALADLAVLLPAALAAARLAE